ncbi:MAG: DUF3048 domain-containing protein [Acidimicrobiales bacterium]
MVALLVAMAGCSSLGGAEIGKGRGATTTTAPKLFPLTGLPVADPALAVRPAISVKIENSPASRPQAGLDKADVVFEEVVEGGQTRFLAVFQSTDASPVGPVRSLRPTDPAIVAPFGGVVAYSGGIPRFVQAMKATGLVNIDETSAGSAFTRRRDKSAPHNLYTSTSALYDKAGNAKAPPVFAQFLKADEPFAPAGGTPVTGLTLAVASATTVGYDWDPAARAWKRLTDGRAFVAEGGTQISAATVIVQFVPYERTGEADTTGSPVSEARIVGSGDAVVFANGTMVRARWSKPSATAMTAWTDQAGAPLQLPPGRTWVELPAVGAALTTR